MKKTLRNLAMSAAIGLAGLGATSRAEAYVVDEPSDIVSRFSESGGVSQDYHGLLELMDNQPMDGNLLVVPYGPDGFYGGLMNSPSAFWLPINEVTGYINEKESGYPGLVVGETLQDIPDSGVIVVRNPNERYFGYVDETLNVWNVSEVEHYFVSSNQVEMSSFSPGSGMGTFDVTVPEPATMGLVFLGSIALLRRKSKTTT